MSCPNKNSKEFKQMVEALGEDLTYYLIDKNNGNPIQFAPNGKESVLYDTFLKELGDETKALQAKAKVYNNEFTNWFGDWVNVNNFELSSDIAERAVKDILTKLDLMELYDEEYIYSFYTLKDNKDNVRGIHSSSTIVEHKGSKLDLGKSISFREKDSPEVIVHELLHGKFNKKFETERNKNFARSIWKAIGRITKNDNILHKSKVYSKESYSAPTEDLVIHYLTNKSFKDNVSKTILNKIHKFIVDNGILSEEEINKYLNLNLSKEIDFKNTYSNKNNVSKVVDENGEPLVVYHGTEQLVDKFKNHTEIKGWERGNFFTSDKNYAKVFGENIYSVFLNIKSPKKIDGLNSTFASQLLTENNNIDGLIGHDAMFMDFFDAGINSNGIEFINKNPNQIKSATDNKGTFSKVDDNIYNLPNYHTVNKKYTIGLDLNKCN